MKPVYQKLSFSLLAIAISSGAYAQTMNLEPAGKFDLTAQGKLVKADVPVKAPYTVEAIEFIQPLNAKNTLIHKDSGQRLSSNEYWQLIKGSELRKGIRLQTSGAEALVRLSRQSNSRQAIDTQKLEVLTEQAGRLNTSSDSRIERLYSEEQLASTELFQRNAGFKLKKSDGQAALVLRSAQKLQDDELILVNVKEKNSPLILTVETPRKIVRAGESIQLHAQLNNNGKQLSDVRYSAKALTPSGKSIPVLVGKNGQITVTEKQSALLGQELERGELLDIELSAVSQEKGAEVQRNTRISVALSQPTARLMRTFDLTLNDKKNQALFDIEVGSAGRYQISAVIYGTDKTGNAQPVMHSQSAQWLEAGQRNLSLPIDTSLLKASGLNAPFQIKDLQLFDQTRLNLIERQANAASFKY